MRLSAYVLAGDPTWLERSVAAYYDGVDRIVVSYDQDDRGWTGAPLAASAVVQRLRELDVDGKMLFLPGSFHGGDEAMKNDTRQREVALAAAGEGADWVLQLDTDEVLPDLAALVRVLDQVDPDVAGVEWPMSVLYRALRNGDYLQVVSEGGSVHMEYPGPVAVRPGVRLRDARRVEGVVERVVVAGDSTSLEITRPPAEHERRSFTISPDQAILHNSWGRSPAVVWRKVRSWGHNAGWRSVAYYALVWGPSPVTARFLKNLHPLYRPLWPRLALLKASALPPSTSD